MSKKKNKKLKVSKKRFQKENKRKRIAETKRKQKVALMTPSTGNINLYHFTGEDSVPSIRKYGLVLGDVMTSLNTGFNAVNLTEQGHFHDPSHNNQGKRTMDIRITLNMNSDNPSLQSMMSFFKQYPNAKRLHQRQHNSHSRGHIGKHWIYQGQIKPEEFVAVHKWNGKEFVEVDLNSYTESWLEKFLTKKKDKGFGVSSTRVRGNYCYDKSGMARTVIKDYSVMRGGEQNSKELYDITDAINEFLYEEGTSNEDNELHQDFQFEINKWVMKGLSMKAFDEIIKAGTFTGITKIVASSIIEYPIEKNPAYETFLKVMKDIWGDKWEAVKTDIEKYVRERIFKDGSKKVA